MRELTLRGLVLGAAITSVFTAANVYLGLKVGLTFASSIPAAVLSMAALRYARGASVLENNIVQTVASAAGTLSSIIFVLPGLVMIGVWHGFPWLETTGLCVSGGVLGIVFTIPLRRAMVLESGLAFPEGVAAAEILLVGRAGPGGGEAASGARALGEAGIVSGAFALVSGGFGLLAPGIAATFVVGRSVLRLATGFSLALVGAGYLMGIAAGLAILLGFCLSWLVAVPWLTAVAPNPDHVAAGPFAMGLWSHKVRFIGAGTIAVAAITTLVSLAPAIGRGMRATAASARAGRGRGDGVGVAGGGETDRDLSLGAIAALAGFGFALLFATLLGFLGAGGAWLALGASLFATLFGFLVAATCGYMAGLVGSSASPISGIAIVAVTLVSLLLLALPAGTASGITGFAGSAVALALFTTTAVIAMATISNDNLQDLKTGSLVGASPRRQQIALVVGVLVGAAVIPPVLNLLYQAYGFAGALPRADMHADAALAAPQATLMAAIAGGILGHRLDWGMISIGLALGVVLIGVDRLLRRRTATLRLPLLPVGIGLYLPPSVGATLVVGAGLSWLVGRLAAGRPADAIRAAGSRGMLLASGLIVGESLVGVVLAGVIGAAGRDDALVLVGPGFAPVAAALGAILFVAVCAWLVRAVLAAPSGAAPGGFPSDRRRG